MDKTKTVPVTQLKRLGSQQPEFTLPVSVRKLNGATVQINLQCKALRKTEWADARDARQRATLEALIPEAELPDTTADAPDTTLVKTGIDAALESIVKKGYAANVRNGLRDDADLVLVFAIGWDLEDEFSGDTLMDLEDEFGGALREILNSYDKAIFQGRLGN